MVRSSYATVGANFPRVGSIEAPNASYSHVGQRHKNCSVFTIAREGFERQTLWIGVIMKTTIFLFGLFFALECWAYKHPPRLTGEELIQYVSSDSPIDREFARGYFASLADAAQGKAWCISPEQKPHEIDAEMLQELQKLPKKRLRERAGVLIIEVLEKKYPCK